MKRIMPFIIMICLLCASCSTSRFTFDRTEKSIKELGGTYNKEVGEEISKIYKNGGIEDVIETVYQNDYEGGDPYVVVEGYLGEDAFEEFKKVVKEKKTAIENLRKGVDLEKDQVGGNEGLALAVLDETYPEGLVIEALGGMDKKNTQDFKSLLDEKIAMRDELRGILDEKGIQGIKEALVNEVYTELEIETYLGKSTLDDAKLLFAKETGTDGFVPVARTNGSGVAEGMEFVAHKNAVAEEEKKEPIPPIIQIVAVLVALVLIYIIAAVARTSYRRALPALPSVAAISLLTAIGIGALTLAMGWSVYWLGVLLALPAIFILTLDTME